MRDKVLLELYEKQQQSVDALKDWLNALDRQRFVKSNRT